MDFRVNKKNIISLIKKELNSLFNNPSSYIVLVVFLILWEFLFFRNAFLSAQSSVRDLFDWLPWLLLVLVPAITMGSISKESEEGTMELVLTHPVKELELIIGKFVSGVIFCFSALIFSIGIAITFSKFGQFDWGIYASQLLGATLFAASLVALGVFVSSLVRGQVAALLLSIGIGFILIISGTEFFTQSFPFAAANIIDRLSLLTHFNSVSKGVIDLRDAVYFLSFIVIFLALAYLQLLKRKYGNNKQKYMLLQTGIFLFVGIFILTSILGERVSVRLDLSKNRVFTLSQATKSTVRNLNDILTVTIYSSQKLPPESTRVLRETKDLLNDYKNNSKGNLKIKVIDPSKDPALAQEAQTLGVPEVRFNVVQGQEFQSVTGYLGMVLSYAGKNEVIPFIQNTSDLEYQLTSAINKLTQKTKKVVGVVVGNGEKNLTDYRVISEELSSQYDVKPIDLKEDTAKIDADVSALIVAGPTEAYSENAKNELRSFMQSGKGVMFLVDTVGVEPSQYSVVGTKVNSNVNDLLKEIGVTVNDDSVYDTQLNETIQLSAGPRGNYLLPYPYWIKALPADNANQITSKLDAIYIPWASSVTTDDNKLKELGYEKANLLVTSDKSGTTPVGGDLQPTTKLSLERLSQKIVGITLTPTAEKAKSLAKIIIISDSDLLTDAAVQNAVQNAVLGINSVAWLAQEQSFGAIKIKSEPYSMLKFSSKNQPEFIKYGNLAAALVIPVLIGTVKLGIRRKLRERNYDL